MSRRLVALVLLVWSLAFALGACKKTASEERTVTPPVVTDASTDLMFTWLDEGGAGHVEQRAADVPAAAREAVRVSDPAHDPPPGEVWIVDLRSAPPGGAYPVHTMKRAEWEGLALSRRDGGGLVARPAASVLPEARPPVIIYGASWCGPCHKAAAYLEQRGIAFVQKDIEADGSATREMQAKLAKAGKRGGSIPVLDVRGRILVGFDSRQLDDALGAAL